MPDPLYVEWEAKWLFTYDMINCSECHAAQLIQQRGRDFEHGPSCTRRGRPAAVYGANRNAQSDP